MIYDFPEPSSPIRQGDIFIGIPILDLPDDELSVIDDEGSVQTLPWEEFASAGEKVSAIIAVRPTIAIVGTQECDALRAPNITLFEVRPFRDVERKSKDMSKPSKWVPIITQHARVNQKWFYLPADKRVGFSEKMGADFLTPIRIPRIVLERLINFRKGRLNEVAGQHFRERLSEFFRRYAYDEWYPLTREELGEYQKNYPNAEPFPWQRENQGYNDKIDGKASTTGEISGNDSEKGHLNHLAQGNEAGHELTAILTWIFTETENLTAKINQHTIDLDQLSNKPEREMLGELERITSQAADDMDTFSKSVEVVLPKFEENIQILDKSYTAHVSLTKPESAHDVEQIMVLRDSLSEMRSLIKPGKESLIGFRDSTLSLKSQNMTEELNQAASRQSQALDGVISNMEQLESFALGRIFLIDEKFAKPPTTEDQG